MLRRNFILLVLVCLVQIDTNRIYGQLKFDSDSAFLAIAKMKLDSSKIENYRQMALKLEQSDSLKSVFFSNKALELSKITKNTKEEARCYLQLANFNLNNNLFEEAKKYGNLALINAQKGEYRFELAQSYSIIGKTLIRQANYQKGLENNLKALKIFESINDNKRTALVLSNIAAVYLEIDNPKKALEFSRKAIIFSLKSKDNEAIGRSYYNHANGYNALNDIPNAVLNYKIGMSYVKKTGLNNVLHQGYYNIANSLYEEGIEKGKFNPETQLYSDSSLALARKIGNPLNLFYALNNSAQMAIVNNKHNLADGYFNEVFHNLQKIKNNFFERMYFASISKFRFKQGRYKEAYLLRMKRDSLNDIYINESNLENINEIETKYETEKKETQIKLQAGQLKQKTTNNLLLIGGISAIALLSLLGFLNYRNRQKIDAQKIKELEQEKQLTAVSSIMQGQEEERSRMAKDLHDGLGGMLSGIKLNLSAMRGNQILQEADANIFSRSIDQLDTAIKEMRRVAHNMMPEALLKFGLDEAVKDFCDGINQAGHLKMKYSHFGSPIPNDQSLQVILYRIIQELSNNAIKYAQAHNIFIQLTKHETGISLTVEDDGKGFDIASLEKIKGTGINNVISRVNYLKGTFTIDSEIGKGTSCFVEIPI